MDVLADEVAREVLEQFDRLPPKAKPIQRGIDNKGINVREWVPLSGIVAKGCTYRNHVQS